MPKEKKDNKSRNYPYPLYAPWTAVEAGKKSFKDKYQKQDGDDD